MKLNYEFDDVADDALQLNLVKMDVDMLCIIAPAVGEACDDN